MQCCHLGADKTLQIPDVVPAFGQLLLVLGELGLAPGCKAAGAGAAHEELVDGGREGGEAPRDLVGLAGDEEADAVVLVAELMVEVVLEALQGMVDLAGDGNGGGLALGGVQLDQLLERVVVNVVEAPSRHGFGLKGFAVFHAWV